MLVPLKSVHNVGPSPGTEERMAKPGATTSGFRRSDSGVGPADENAATSRASSDAPTAIARSDDAGERTEPLPARRKSFPAAVTGTTPATAAPSSASATTSRDGSTSGWPRDKLMTSIP